MQVQLTYPDELDLPLAKILAHLRRNMLKPEVLKKMERVNVTYTMGCVLNDPQGKALPENSAKVEIVWNDVPYEMGIALQGLFADLLKEIQKRTSRWGVEAERVRREAGGDKAKIEQGMREIAAGFVKEALD